MDAVECSVESAVLTVRLNRPDRRNAINDAVYLGLDAAVREAAADPGVQAVVLTGTGRAFCAGGDIAEMEAMSAEARLTRLRRNMALLQAWRNLPKPVVAAINGPAIGAGFSLALACDILHAADTAFFSMPFAARALVPDLGASYYLARQVGLYRAKEICLTGRRVGVQEALQLGVISAVHGPEELAATVAAIAAELAAGPTGALGMAKTLINATFESDFGNALEKEAFAQGVAMAGAEHRHAVQRYLSGQAGRVGADLDRQ